MAKFLCEIRFKSMPLECVNQYEPVGSSSDCDEQNHSV